MEDRSSGFLLDLLVHISDLTIRNSDYFTSGYLIWLLYLLSIKHNYGILFIYSIDFNGFLLFIYSIDFNGFLL